MSRRAAGGIAIAAGWGFAEATLFFIVPDVYVGRVAVRAPRRAIPAWLGAVCGAVLGSVVLHRAVSSGANPDRLFRSLPGMRKDDLERVRRDVEMDQARAFVAGAVSGLPLKLYVAEAARLDVGLGRTIVLVVLNRAPRIGAVALAMSLIGAIRSRAGPSTGRMIDVAYGLGWVLFYSWYWRRANGPEFDRVSRPLTSMGSSSRSPAMVQAHHSSKCPGQRSVLFQGVLSLPSKVQGIVLVPPPATNASITPMSLPKSTVS